MPSTGRNNIYPSLFWWFCFVLPMLYALHRTYYYVLTWINLSLTPAPEDVHPSYGFFFQGNMSLYSPEVMSRTDLNESSPTYGMWIPPEGAPLPPCLQPRPRPRRA